jgi:cob(I)alamin adenosyltransferase
MNGDQNMYQNDDPGRLGRNWNTKPIPQPVQSLRAEQDIEQYKSQIERQCVEMQATIDLLKATVETLRKRLKPVMADAPMRTADHDLAPVASPLGVSINQYRQQTTAVIDELAHIIESLEI